MNGYPTMWPDLSRFPSFRHRLATRDDINAGRAAFLVPGLGSSTEAPIGVPLDIIVPQYAYHLDKESGTKHPGVLIQAVEVGGIKIGAIMLLTNQQYAVAPME